MTEPLALVRVLQKLLPSDPCYSKSVGFPGKPFQPRFVGINTCQLSNSHFQPIYIYVYSISQANESRCLGVVKTCNHYVGKPLPFTTRRELSNRPCHELGLGRLNMVFLGEVFSRGLYSQSTL